MMSAVTHLYFISYIHLRVCDSLDLLEFLNVDDIIITSLMNKTVFVTPSGGAEG